MGCVVLADLNALCFEDNRASRGAAGHNLHLPHEYNISWNPVLEEFIYVIRLCILLQDLVSNNILSQYKFSTFKFLCRLEKLQLKVVVSGFTSAHVV